MPKPVMLVILDGWGHRTEAADNAVALARTPHVDALWARGPRNFLHTSGADVGLPDGQIGNSEVGHLNIGAGRVVMQDLPRIDAAIEDGALPAMPPLQDFIAAVQRSGGTAHLIGLVSPGGVHSHHRHAVALARALDRAGVPVAIHAWVDGRDTAPRAAGKAMAALAKGLEGCARTRVVTVIGRYYAMDRDNRWDRVEKAWRAMVLGEGEVAPDAATAIAANHAADRNDEFLPPTVLPGHAAIRDGDGVLCWNFRADRVRQILAALLDPGFEGFARPRTPRIAAALGMTEYSRELNGRMATLFGPESMQDILGAVVSAAGRTQLRLAETEKYPHVTYFLNGGEETPFPGEERLMVPSPRVATYDLQPEMSAPELSARAVAAIAAGRHDLVVLNFANADMVGHTGSLTAAIRACEAVDRGLGAIVQAMEAAGGALLVTADHGNAELMRDPEDGGPHTAHTTHVVPVMLMGGPADAVLREGRLADVAPTLLALMGIGQPAAMTGRSLLA